MNRDDVAKTGQRYQNPEGVRIAFRRRFRDDAGLMWDEWDDENGDLYVTLTSESTAARGWTKTSS